MSETQKPGTLEDIRRQFIQEQALQSMGGPFDEHGNPLPPLPETEIDHIPIRGADASGRVAIGPPAEVIEFPHRNDQALPPAAQV